MTNLKKSLVKEKYEGVGWALLLILLGVLLAVPESWVPDGIGRLIIGLLILSYWAAGRLKKFAVSWVLFALGAILVLSGVAKLAGWAVSLFPIALILIGCAVLYNTLRPGGKAS